MMNLYFVDYENVNNVGLKGIETLKENDRVIILYSMNASTINIESIKEAFNSKAKVSFLEITSLGKNALDFQLSAILGYCIASCKENNLTTYIVSRDRGYDSLVTGLPRLLKDLSGNQKLNLTIKKLGTIGEHQKVKKRLELTNTNSKLTQSKYKKNLDGIVKIIQENIDRTQDKGKICSQVHNELIKKYPTNGKLIYNAIKNDLKKDLKANLA